MICPSRGNSDFVLARRKCQIADCKTIQSYLPFLVKLVLLKNA
jgi:hypothetical protein